MKKLKWQKFSDPSQVKAVLDDNLTSSTSVEEVKQFTEAQQFECSELVDDVIYCSTPAKRLLLVFKAKWLMQFHFTANKLSEIKVKVGYITP